MSERNLGRFLGELWRREASQPALWGRGEGGGLEVWAAGRALAQVTRLGVGLQAETLERGGVTFAPLAAGTRVLIAAPQEAEGLVMALAAWSVGAVTIHVAPDLPEELLGQALERMKAEVVLVDSRQTLGGLELASDAALREASVLMLEGAPEPAVPRVLGWGRALELGGRYQVLGGLERLARSIFEVPPEARAAIFYWAEGGALKAAALTHGEVLGALPALPRGWGLAPGEGIYSALSLGDREGVLWTLRALAHRHVLALSGGEVSSSGVAQVAPRALWAEARVVEALLDGLDRGDERSVRGALKRGLGWLEGRRGGGVAGEVVAAGLGGWAERGLAALVRRDLGGSLRLVFCPGGGLSADAAALLQAGGVEVVGR